MIKLECKVRIFVFEIYKRYETFFWDIRWLNLTANLVSITLDSHYRWVNILYIDMKIDVILCDACIFVYHVWILIVHVTSPTPKMYTVQCKVFAQSSFHPRETFRFVCSFKFSHFQYKTIHVFIFRMFIRSCFEFALCQEWI